MNDDQEEVWERLKRGLRITVVTFVGNGIAHKFNSGWLSEVNLNKVRITVDDVARSEFRDFSINYNDIIFYEPPAAGHKIVVEIFD